VVTTTIEPRRHTRGSSFDAYEYTVHSHTYVTDKTPTAKFTYDLSPIQVGKGVGRGGEGEGGRTDGRACVLMQFPWRGEREALGQMFLVAVEMVTWRQMAGRAALHLH
jgi:hypothetical protein